VALGYRDHARIYGTSVVRGFTLVEVLVAFTIAILAVGFIQQSLSLIAQRLYTMKRQEKDLQMVSHIQDIVIAQRTSSATLLDRKGVENSTCDVMSYRGFNYYACPQEFGIQRIYLPNGYSFLTK
jgi:type II secretory pathway pseudopilin PulG